MNLHLSLELVRIGAFSFPDTFSQESIDLGVCGRDSMESLANAINCVRQYGMAQLLGTPPNSSMFKKEDYCKAAEMAFLTLLTDIEQDGERFSVDFTWSKAGVLVITLRREEPRKVDMPAPNA